MEMLLNLHILTLCYTWITHSEANTGVTAVCYGEPGINLPMRYFFVQVQRKGENVSESVGKIKLRIHKADSCRLAQDVVDRFDGKYIIRLRLFTPCRSLRLSLLLADAVLCDVSITNVDGSVPMPETCDCPIPLDEWLQNADCPEEPQIQSDLSRWRSINFSKLLSMAQEKWGGERNRFSTSFCHYRIHNNKIYRRCSGEYTGFAAFSDNILLSLSRKMFLPDTEFIMNLGDYPLSRNDDREKLPVWSWCGSSDTSDIVVPTYELANSVLQGLTETELDVHTARGREGWIPWEQRKPSGIFRGRDSNQLRLDLSSLSSVSRELVDAGITRYFFFEESQHTPTVESIPFHHFFKNRYVISVDGTVAAYRLPFLLSGDSLLLKAISPYYEHFYSRMEPFRHFIPFTRQNITQTIEWLRRTDLNQSLREKEDFVSRYLQPVNIYCYFATLFKEYSRLLVRGEDGTVPDDMSPIVSAPSLPCPCNTKHKEEL